MIWYILVWKKKGQMALFRLKGGLYYKFVHFGRSRGCESGSKWQYFGYRAAWGCFSWHGTGEKRVKMTIFWYKAAWGCCLWYGNGAKWARMMIFWVLAAWGCCLWYGIASLLSTMGYIENRDIIYISQGMLVQSPTPTHDFVQFTHLFCPSDEVSGFIVKLFTTWLTPCRGAYRK